MEFEITSQLKNLLLKREEFQLQISSDSNPSFEELKTGFGKNPDLTVIKKIKGNFGLKKFSAEVFVYDSNEAKNQTEIIPRKIRKKLAEEAKKAEAKKAEEEKNAKEAEIKEGEKTNGS